MLWFIFTSGFGQYDGQYGEGFHSWSACEAAARPLRIRTTDVRVEYDCLPRYLMGRIFE